MICIKTLISVYKPCSSDKIPTIEECQNLANKYLRDELKINKIAAASTNNFDLVFDDERLLLILQ